MGSYSAEKHMLNILAWYHCFGIHPWYVDNGLLLSILLCGYTIFHSHIHHIMDTWIVARLWLWWLKLQWAFRYIQVFTRMNVFAKNTCLTTGSDRFSEGRYHVSLPPTICENPSCSTFLFSHDIVHLLNYSNKCLMMSLCGFNLAFLYSIALSICSCIK